MSAKTSPSSLQVSFVYVRKAKQRQHLKDMERKGRTTEETE